MTKAPPSPPHLVGAYGMFWERDEVFWNGKPGASNSWQLLGRRNANKHVLQVCDFRQARGFYILFGDHGASYVGLARGGQGLGQRLKAHANNPSKKWSRFCWFSFDDVVGAAKTPGWSSVKKREAVRSIDAETTVRELEALLIQILGTVGQNQMRFLDAQPWTQVTLADCRKGRPLSKVDTSPLTQPEFKTALASLA